MKLKRLIIIIAIAALAIPAGMAVTKEEMEQARTITAQCYLRWANNGSGYLDEHSPKTMSELESILKEKEKQNLKAFKAVSVPGDYASWDKDKLVEYWSKTFFNAPGLDSEGKKAHIRVANKIKAMTVSAPAPAAEEKPAEEVAPAPVEEASQEPAAVTEVETAAEKADSLIAAETELEEVTAKKSNSGTWVYVAILCVLVAVVVWLVVFASKTMKQQGGKVRKNEETAEPVVEKGGKPRVIENKSVRQEPIYESSAGKYEHDQREKSELEMLSAELANVRKQRDDARRNCAALKLEIEDLTARLQRAEMERDRALASSSEAVAQPTYTPRQASRRPEITMYLGRANNQGIFVRAERQLNPDHSIYCLTTRDGINGTFTVVNMPEVVDRVLEDPTQFLSNGCTGRALDVTDDVTSIETKTPGAAVFEGGCWRVTRKAAIAYV